MCDGFDFLLRAESLTRVCHRRGQCLDGGTQLGLLALAGDVERTDRRLLDLDLVLKGVDLLNVRRIGRNILRPQIPKLDSCHQLPTTHHASLHR